MNSEQIIMEQAKTFIKDNIQSCAIELLMWQDTAELCSGKLREAADILKPLASSGHSLPLAVSITQRELLELFVANIKEV